MKIPFDIKYKQDIIDGKVKVVAGDGSPVEILLWDARGDYPIIGVVTEDGKDTPDSWTLEGKTVCNEKDYDNDLFILTNDPDLAEFEKFFMNDISEVHGACIPLDMDAVKESCNKLFELAKKEIMSDLPKWKKETLQIKDMKNAVECIDWLEKQGEKPQGKTALEAIKEEKVDNANKVEPKFKVGDWVVFSNKHQSIYQVEKIEDGYYILRHTHGGTFRVCVLHDESLRLFTIEDVTEGDVLEFGDHGRPVVGIVSYVNKTTGRVDVNCLLENNNFKVGNYYNLDTIKPHPATKQQRDLLFQKIKEAGYEWDAEKKEPKKIEQKTAETTKSEEWWKELSLSLQIQAYLNTASDELYAKGKPLYSEKSIDDIHKCMKMWAKLHNSYFYDGEQKPIEWSEEDEHWRQKAIGFMKHPDLIKATPTLAKNTIDWLKSLKERYTWKPSDEQMAALSDINVTGCISYAGQGQELINLFNDLKKLREE